MKRSDMINLISEHITDAIEVYVFTKEVKNKLFAEKILNSIQKMGMLPPKSKHNDPGHFPGDSFEYEINEWEDEDET